MNTHCDANPLTLNSNDNHNNNNHLKRNNASSAVIFPLIQNSGDPPYRVRVLGISDGTKSRVETQIRLELQLIDDQGKQPHQWSHIRIATSLLTQKRRNASTSTLTTTHGKRTALLDQDERQQLGVPEQSTLRLDASVVCESDIHRQVKMCRRCVYREWKRADRKKSARKLGKDGIYDEALLEKERHRMLLINSDPVLAFDQGECILPTRITCYSRHHNERQGFRIKFTIHDYQGHLVATGNSARIMITDDHKNLSKLGDKRRRRKTKASKSSPTPSPPCLPTPEEETLPTFEESAVLLATRPIEGHDLPSPGTNAIESVNQQDDMMESKISYFMDPTGYHFHPNLFTPTPALWSGSPPSTDAGSPLSSSPPSPILTMMYSPYQQQLTTLERMIPDQASIDGGTEITLLGSNFYEGMTWVFGDQPALMTTFWSSTTLVCTVPPASHPGPVLVRCLDSLWPSSPSLIFNYVPPSSPDWNIVSASSLSWQQLLHFNNDHGTTG